MSNKTEIQTLNAKYESLIEELRGKAVGGGDGGSVETCTVTMTGSGVLTAMPTAYFTDENLTVQSVQFTGSKKGYNATATVAKGTLLQIVGVFTGGSVSGDCTNLSGAKANPTIAVNGDCTISVTA